jgi:uncharacterized protein
MINDFMPTLSGEYLNFESYRGNGAAIRTPMWFAESGPSIYVYTLTNTPKVKRVRNNPQVRIAACDMRGNLKGDWINAKAQIVENDEAIRGQALLREKYGWKKAIGDFYSRLVGRKRTVIRIDPQFEFKL